jgi:2-iminobutanoate/2-iminopropanoate deaminase
MKKIIFTQNAPTPIGPYSQAVLSGNTLYVSGQIPSNPLTGELMLGSIEEQTKQVMENLKAILNEVEMSFDNVVKATIFITDMNDFSKINSVYGSYFSETNAPARETVQVSRLPKDVNVEISVIAVK